MRLDFSEALYVGSNEASRAYLGSNLIYTNSLITFLGKEDETSGGLFAVSNWSNPSVEKKFNVGALEKYGTSGYYQIRPGTTEFVQAASAGNNLGISAGTNPTLYSAPPFATVTGAAGNFANFLPYASFQNPSNSASIRQGALSVQCLTGPFTTPSGTNTGNFGEAFTITMTQNADFVLGVAVNTVGSNSPELNYSPTYVSVFTSTGGTGTVFSSFLIRSNADPRMPFFLIRGSTGDVFIAAMWQLVGQQTFASAAFFSLITFDQV
jgi:hypothetical protein